MRLISVIMAMLLVPCIAYAGILAEAFGPGGVGFPIVLLLVVAAFGALVCYITSALGMGQISSMVKLVTVFGCISIVINSIWNAISAIAKAFNLQL